MNSNVQVGSKSDSPVFAGNARFLLGLALITAGLYIGLFSNIQGHALGLFLVLASPFVIFKDEESFKERRFATDSRTCES